MATTNRQLRRYLPALALVLTGCASQVPQAIRGPTTTLTPDAVRAQPQRHNGAQVRWGGRILDVRNKADSTEVELLGYPLDHSGEPRANAVASGRFIATFAGFQDPTAFPRKRLMTVSGRFTGVEQRPIGEYPYHYPLIAVTARHLWPEQAEPNRRPMPYGSIWYGYGPWYGFYPYPWY